MDSVESVGYFDAHAHLQEPQIVHDLTGMMERWQAMQGREIVCCGIHEKDWSRVLEIADNYGQVLPCLGLHPWFVQGASSHWKECLLNLIDQNPHVVAIGEIGLDFVLKSADRELQEKVFTSQLIMAKEKGIPVSIHVRKAWERLVAIMKKIGPLPQGGQIHSYSGSADLVPVLEKMGFYISFSGSVTQGNNKKVRKALCAVSPKRLLIETDSPAILPRYPMNPLLPENWKHQRSSLYLQGWNEPANLFLIALSVSEIFSLDMRRLMQRTRENGLRLFQKR